MFSMFGMFPAKITFSIPVKLNESNARVELEAGPEDGVRPRKSF